LPSITIGVVDVRDGIGRTAVAALAKWILKDRVAFLTGWFGNHPAAVADLAKLAGAISTGPIAQVIVENGGWSRGPSFMPNYLLAFGPYNRYECPEDPAEFPEDFPTMADDLWEVMVPLDQMPDWENSSLGNPSVPQLGKIVAKDPNFKRWRHNVFQTVLWIGTSTPSKNSQKRQSQKGKGRSRGKGKHKAEDKGNDKGKGKGKGKDKGKCKDKGKGKGWKR